MAKAAVNQLEMSISRFSQFARRNWLFVALSALIISVACSQRATPDWPGLKQTIKERFPDVRQLSTTELSGWLSGPESERPLLLDARKPEEYSVSHLSNAQLAASEAQALEILKAEPHNRLIVVYCSVGYRSSSLAQQLQARGYTNVYDLEGSIFEWANDGRPVYQGEPEIKLVHPLVHPYDAKWGAFLKRELRSPLP